MSGGKDTTLQEKQMRKAMTAIDTLVTSGEQESINTLLWITNYASSSRAELQASIDGNYVIFRYEKTEENS